jgi:ABC-type antimicrobial peptide transport system permease subunit
MRAIYFFSGLPGFIGIFVGFATGDYFYFNSSLFFLWFTHKGNRDDERWERNMGRASRNALLLIMGTLFSLSFYNWSLQVLEVSPLLLTILLVIGVSSFMLSYAYYDRRGD